MDRVVFKKKICSRAPCWSRLLPSQHTHSPGDSLLSSTAPTPPPPPVGHLASLHRRGTNTRHPEKTPESLSSSSCQTGRCDMTYDVRGNMSSRYTCLWPRGQRARTVKRPLWGLLTRHDHAASSSPSSIFFSPARDFIVQLVISNLHPRPYRMLRLL